MLAVAFGGRVPVARLLEEILVLCECVGVCLGS